jgi:hypothetical protein
MVRDIEAELLERQRRELKTDALKLTFPDDALLERLAALADAPRERFAWVIRDSIICAHGTEALSNSKKIPHKKIAHHARELAKLIRTSDGKHLSYLTSSALTIAELLEGIDDLAKCSNSIGASIKSGLNTGAVNLGRHRFVTHLLIWTHMAGGRLTLNRREEGGSLFEVVKLLKPFLPNEISSKLSFSTLRRTYDPWVKSERLEHPRLKKETRNERTSS